jgi:peptidoglycan/xylan/chitin deacetylase (PgdA/CDA1 family)
MVLGLEMTVCQVFSLNAGDRDGHELGNHTMYDRRSVALDLSVLKEEILEVDSLITKHQKLSPIKWFRPGGGFFSSEMLSLVESMGYRHGNRALFQAWRTVPDLDTKLAQDGVRICIPP